MNFPIRKIDTTTLEADLSSKDSVTELVEALKENGVEVKDIRAKGNRLESVFLNLLK